MLTAYVVVGGLLVAYLSFSVVADVARYHRVLTAMANANVPEVVADHVGRPQSSRCARTAGRHRRATDRDDHRAISMAAAVIGTAAAVGVIVFFVGAVITHLRARDYSLAPATVFLLLAVTTLVLGLAS